MTQSWWQRMSSNERKIAIIAPIVILCIVVGVIVGVVASNNAKKNKVNSEIDNEKPKTSTEKPIITTEKPKIINEKLKETAESLHASMDFSVDPCEDFYAFTCGKFNSKINKFSVLQQNVYQDLKDVLDTKANQRKLSSQKKLIDAYSSCFHTFSAEIQIRELKSLLKEVGGWPMGDRTWDENKYDIDIALANAIKTTGVTPLVGFSVLPDMKNTTRNIIMLSAPIMIQGGLNPFKEFLLNLASSYPFFSFSSFSTDMTNVISLENDLRRITAESRESGQEYHRFQIKALSSIIQGVDLIQFFQIITNTSLNNMNQYLTEDDYVAVSDLQYLQKLATLVQSPKFSMRVYANYIGAKIVLQATALVLSVVGTPEYTYPKQTLAYSRAPTNWYVCLYILAGRLNYVMDRVYVDYTGKKADKKTTEMIEYIKKSFETLAKQADWLDKETLSAAIEKLQAMRNYIGYPSWIMQDKQLEDYYNSLPDMGNEFGENLKKISTFVIDKMLRQLRQINNLNEWPTVAAISTTLVNAAYMQPFNAICFPLAIQQFPFYDSDLPWYLNFGAIGAVIGHEITHGFDSIGRTRDKNGNIKNWWSAKATESFNEKAECFVQQYDRYYDTQTSLNVNGSLTLPENIADNGGLRQAFLTYQTWEKEFGKETPLPGFEKYTPQQLFFISYGSMWCETYDTLSLKNIMKTDVHTPSPYRVWGAISNSKEFSKTFNCPAGKKMNPLNKCIIW